MFKYTVCFINKTMKKLILLMAYMFSTNIAFAQYTQVPDSNFEQALIDLGIDSEGTLDGQFLTADAENEPYLGVQNRNINDLTGIEAFVNLEWLDAFENNISQIDFSLITSPVFYTLNLGDNQLIDVDLSPISNIVNIGLNNNNITTIDASNLTQAFILTLSDNPLVEITLNNTHLQILRLQNTLITELNLSTVISLQKIFLPDSQIQSLDFSNNPILEEVNTFNTPLASINLPNNPSLTKMNVSKCQLTELDVTNCPGLLDLKCGENTLTNLDLTNNTLLGHLSVTNNQITHIDLTNNPNIFRFWAINNLIEGDLDFSSNPILENLWLDNNLFTSIDLSQNQILEQVDIIDNPNLEMVNIKNGENENIYWLSVFNCPNLSCIVVDDPLADNDFILVEQNATINLVGSVEECNLAINENELQNLLQVYPNPVKNTLNFNTPKNVIVNKITIYNALGSLVLQNDNPKNSIDVSKLSSGLLFVKIETDQGIVTKKIIKE